jgi:hypothetical protein
MEKMKYILPALLPLVSDDGSPSIADVPELGCVVEGARDVVEGARDVKFLWFYSR